MHGAVAVQEIPFAGVISPAGPHDAVGVKEINLAINRLLASAHGTVRTHVIPVSVVLDPACMHDAVIVQVIPLTFVPRPTGLHDTVAVQQISLAIHIHPAGLHNIIIIRVIPVASNAKPGGGRLTEPSISRIIKNRLKGAGYDSRRIVPHSLRHTSVTLDRKAGASLEEASKHARHSSITITQRYDHALEKADAKDERRIMDYLFNGDSLDDPQDQAAALMAKIPASKRAKALELLEALAM